MSTNSNYRWLTPLSQKFLEKDYLLPGQTVDERVDLICERAEAILGIPGYALRLKENFQKGWYSFSTPLWVNFGCERGLPISCFGSSMSDSMEGILDTHAEIGMMTKFGGGTSAYFGNLRARGSVIKGNGNSHGSVHFAGLHDSLMRIVSQGSTRRGNFAGYWPIDHPDIKEVLMMRTDGHPIQDISFGVTVPDAWMESMIGDGSAWNSGQNPGDMAKRDIWAKVMRSRALTGFPFIMWSDTVNNGAPDVYRDLGLWITHSNLCSEICLPDDDFESFVCDLASMNILHFDEWKDTDAVEVLSLLLDAVMTEFIEKASVLPHMERAVRFAVRHRALGIGWLGYHSYLQSKGIPFESLEAKRENAIIARNIYEAAYAASRKMVEVYGFEEPEVLRGYGRRNTTLLAIAPTKSSAFILGQVSEGIEPHRSNYFIKDLAKGKFPVRNPHLADVLEAYGKNDESVWDSILENKGSVQHLSFLTPREKATFRTFREISPLELVIQASIRQRWLDQSQSLNLLIDPKTEPKDVCALLCEAWRLGVKTLYYQINNSASQELARDIMQCSSCEA